MKTKMKRNIEDASLDYWPCYFTLLNEIEF